MAEVMEDHNKQNHSKIGRRLGGNEALYAHTMEVGGASIVYDVGVIESSHRLSLRDVREAGRILASRQEALRMHIVHTEPNNNFKFNFTPNENWDQIDARFVNLQKKKDWPITINEESERLFDCKNGPIWSIIVGTVDKNDGENQNIYVVILKIHHSICDAKSAFDVMYRQYLPILSAIVNKESPSEIISKDIPLQPPCEDAFENTRMPWYMRVAINAYRWYARHFVTATDHLYKYTNDPEKSKGEILAEPEFYPYILNKEITKYVVTASKSNGVSVHCVLLGVSSAALCAVAEDSGITIANNIIQGWPIDIRKFLDWTSPQPLCAYHSVAITTTKKKTNYTHEEFWKMCQEISTGVRANNTKAKSASGMSFGSYFIEEGEKCGSVLDVMKVFGSAASSNISNLGVCDNSPEPRMSKGDVQIKLVEHYFGVSGTRSSNMTPFYHYLSTFKGQIMWNLCHNPNKVSKTFVENYIKKIQELLYTFCGPERY